MMKHSNYFGYIFVSFNVLDCVVFYVSTVLMKLQVIRFFINLIFTQSLKKITSMLLKSDHPDFSINCINIFSHKFSHYNILYG